jgi:hypothetical protein
MATYCDIASSNCSLNLLPIQYVNLTTWEWRVNPLPSNINVYDAGNAQNTPGYYAVERAQPSMIGSLSLVSFIYMIMTFLVIIIMASTVVGWIQAAVGQRPYEYTFFLPTSTGALTEREFNRRLRKHYPSAPRHTPLPSYAETAVKYPHIDCSSQGLREFRDLIRKKYAMDVQVWNSRFVSDHDQPRVDDIKRRSRGATSDMLEAVQRWVSSRSEWSADEYQQVQEIYYRIQELNNAELARSRTGA